MLVCGLELMVADRHAKMEIMKLEEELPLWRTALDTGSPLGTVQDFF